MRRMRPEGMATIVRTAAAGVSEAELLADIGVQVRLWHTILESYRRASAPALLHKDLNLVFKAVRDFLTSDVESVVIDSKEQYEEIRSTMSLFGPQYLNRLKLWQGPGNLFQVRGIDDELQKLLKPKIFLPSGGHLIIESTEALTVVDVNTGKFTGGRNLEDTIVRTNIEAAAEIARQVRLRDIGGIIVVDFIDMSHERSREQVIATLSDALRRDRTRSTIQMFSNLGLLEFTRKRVGKDLAGQLRSDCPYCNGLGDVMSSETLAIGLLRQIRQNGIDQGSVKNWDLVTDPSVATQLMGWYREEFEKLGKSLNADLRLYVQPQRHREQVLVEPAQRQRRPFRSARRSKPICCRCACRIPHPASRSSDNWLIEVKDAANGVGQTVKLRVTSEDGNLVRAELAEPLAVAKRRRRRRGKAAAEGEDAAKPLPPAQPARLDRVVVPSNVFGLDEDEEEDYTMRGRPAGRTRGVSSTPSRPPAGRAPAGRASAPARGRDESRTARGGRDESRSGPGRGGRGPQGRRGRGPAEERGFKPLVVGGESDIDYEDNDESSVVVVPDRTKPIAAAVPMPRAGDEQDDSAEGPRRRRRRRGRGGRKTGEVQTDAVVDIEGDVVDVEVLPDEQGDAPIGEEPVERERRPRRFQGPIRQLYGAPVEIDPDATERRPRERDERLPRERDERRPVERDERRPRPSERPERRPVRDASIRPPRDARRMPARPAEPFGEADVDDDLDTVVAPVRPASIDIEFVPADTVRPRRDDDREPRRDGRDTAGTGRAACRRSRW